MSEKIEIAAKDQPEKKAENGQIDPGAENNSEAPATDPSAISAEDIEAAVKLVVETASAEIVDRLPGILEQGAAQAFAKILNDPATALAARQAAIDAEDKARAEAAEAEAELAVENAKEAEARRVAESKARTKVEKAAKDEYGRLSLGEVGSALAIPFLAEGTPAPDGLQILLRLADGERFLVDQDVPVSLGDIRLEGERLAYLKRLEPRRNAPSAVAREVWLLFRHEGKEGKFHHALRADLGSALHVGGGALAAIPAGHLAF